MATLRPAAEPRAHRGRRRRQLAPATLAVLVTILTVGLLSGCSNGFGAQTDQIYQPGPGVSVRQDGVYLLNAAIITNGSGHGTLVGALVDQRRAPDRLLAATVTGPGNKVLTVTILTHTVALPSQQGVQLAFSGAVRVDGTLTPGADYQLTMTFHNGAPISTLVPVLGKSADFHDVPIGPVPSTAVPTTPGTVGTSPTSPSAT